MGAVGLGRMVVTTLSDPGQLGAADRQNAGGDAGSDHPARPAGRECGQFFAAPSTAEASGEVADPPSRPGRRILGRMNHPGELLDRTPGESYVRTAKRDPQHNSKLDCQLRAGLGNRHSEVPFELL